MIQSICRLYSIVFYDKILGRIPCAIQYILVVYLVYVKQCIVSVNPRCNLLISEREEEEEQIRSTELTTLSDFFNLR